MEIKYENILAANETIKTTDIKGKDYAEVNQRIKAFRMVYPDGTIETEMISNQNGVCVFRAKVGYTKTVIDEEKGILADVYTLLGTGTAYEKENSTFINKTSYIENCETSAVGRALGMCGFGIDTSVASAEEVQNAMNNQEPTQEEAEEYILDFGKHKGKTIKELPEDYIEWLVGNPKTDSYVLKCIELITGKKPLTDEEQKENADLLVELIKLMKKAEEETDFNREDMFKHYGTDALDIEQTKEAIQILKKKLGE